MRTPLLTLAAVIAFGTSLQAQTMADALNERCKLTWIGLDFSEAKLVSTVDFAEVERDPNFMIVKWNNLIEQERDKFDLGKALGVKGVMNNTSLIRAANEGITADDILSREAGTLAKSKVPDMVKDYKFEGEGVGVVFIVSTYNKPELMAEYYVTFFNMATKEVLHSERVLGKPQGFGIRNFWAGSVNDALKQIEKEYAKTWRSQFK